MPGATFRNAGDSALVVEFGMVVDPALHDRVLALDDALAQSPIAGVIETVPTYRSLMVHYDPRTIRHDELVERLQPLAKEPSAKKPRRHAVWEIPVCYELPHAEDLAAVASALSLSEERIVEIHSAATYRLYMYGFLPGFGYFGKLPDAIQIPRRAKPRSPVPTSSVLIAGEQVVISGVEMQTGWYMIGRTPERLFELHREPPFIFAVGDELAIRRITAKEYERLDARAERGEIVSTRR